MATTKPKDEVKVADPAAQVAGFGTALATAQTTAIAAAADLPNFEEDAGAGIEGADRDSFAIPFLSVLQKSSPQVDEDSPTKIEGAKAGMFYENVTGRMFEGREKGVEVVPCAFRRVFLRWGPRSGGGGFKGEMLPEVVEAERAAGRIKALDGRLFFPLPDGSVNPDKCDRVADVRNHYLLLLTEDGGYTQALLSLGSTQIKKSKALMATLAGIRDKGANGLYMPPTYSRVVSVKTVPESNDKGNWSGVRMEVVRKVESRDVYEAAKAFNKLIKEGNVEVKYDDHNEEVGAETPTGAAGSAGGTF